MRLRFKRPRRRRVPPVHVPVGTIGLVIAKVGATRPSENSLVAPVECDNFQDSQRFLTGGGQQGRQPQVLASGSYAIDTDKFEVITVDTPVAASREGLSMSDLREITIAPGETGVVVFLANGGRREVQEETLPEGGSYAINPWFARVVRVPARGLTVEWGVEELLQVRVVFWIPTEAAPALVSRMAEHESVEQFVEREIEATVADYFTRNPFWKFLTTRSARMSDELRFEVRETLRHLGVQPAKTVVQKPELGNPELRHSIARPTEATQLEELALRLGAAGVRRILARGDMRLAEELMRFLPQAEVRKVLSALAGKPQELGEDPISTGHGGTAVLTDTAEVTIYLSDQGAHERVQNAVEEFLARAGADVVGRDDPVLGSWFRRIHAKLTGAARSPIAREAMTSAAHAMESRFVHARDAAVTKDLMSNLGPLIKSLEDVDEAVIRVGALLTVKSDGRLIVCQLTAKQQLQLEHNPSLATSPQEILGALEFGVNGSPRPVAELNSGEDVP